MKKLIAWFRIPKGDYCYFGTRSIGTKRCPYYREFWPTDEWSDHVSYCRYLDYPTGDDWDVSLFDQCKICGIKEL
jgi:hypothetical protein